MTREQAKVVLGWLSQARCPTGESLIELEGPDAIEGEELEAYKALELLTSRGSEEAVPVDLVFDGEGPDKRFVEAELEDGRSVNVGTWRTRSDDFQALRVLLLLPKDS